MYFYPKELRSLINEISKFPGVGPKMAERIALSIIKKEEEYIENLREVFENAKKISFCPKCFGVSTGGECLVCADTARNSDILCVVELPEDIINLEKTTKFNGYYHVLQGLINPLNNMLADNIRIAELEARLRTETGKIKELILALNHTVEGDATALYITAVVRKLGYGIKITRLAKGLPTGSDIRYADEITLGQALMERKEVL